LHGRGAFYRPSPKSRQRDEPQLDDGAGARRHRRGGAAPQAYDPHDVMPGVDEWQPVALPSRHLRIDQKRLQPAISAAKRPEPAAPPTWSHDEPRRQPGRVERDAITLTWHRVIRGGDHDGLERAADLRQVYASGHGEIARCEHRRPRGADAHAIAAHLDDDAAQPERPSRPRPRQNPTPAPTPPSPPWPAT